MAENVQLTERALERRVKRWLASAPFECFIQAAPGLEDTLHRELTAAGYKPGEAAPGGVPVDLDAAGIMYCNLTLRSASRVLLRLGNFPGGSREMLFDRARRLPWELILGMGGTYRLHLISQSSKLQAGDELAQVLTDAIHRHMRELGVTVKHDDESPLEIHVRLLNDHATLSFNTSGEHLHRRGFRRYIGEAPLRETVAAAVALEAWDGHDLVVDPFCGAGTLLLELADHASGLPPGRKRGFAFQQAAWFRPGLWREVQRQAEPTAERQVPRIMGFDLDEKALRAAERNLQAAGHDSVQLEAGDATRLDYGALPGNRRLLVANLPYGKRLGTPEQAEKLHRSLVRRVAEGGEWDLTLLTTQPRTVRRLDVIEVISEQAVSSGGLRISLLRARTKPQS